jgi:hypothetical protein
MPAGGLGVTEWPNVASAESGGTGACVVAIQSDVAGVEGAGDTTLTLAAGTNGARGARVRPGDPTMHRMRNDGGRGLPGSKDIAEDSCGMRLRRCYLRMDLAMTCEV